MPVNLGVERFGRRFGAYAASASIKSLLLVFIIVFFKGFFVMCKHICIGSLILNGRIKFDDLHALFNAITFHGDSPY